jgi:hypothetical protein
MKQLTGIAGKIAGLTLTGLAALAASGCAGPSIREGIIVAMDTGVYNSTRGDPFSSNYRIGRYRISQVKLKGTDEEGRMVEEWHIIPHEYYKRLQVGDHYLTGTMPSQKSESSNQDVSERP